MRLGFRRGARVGWPAIATCRPVKGEVGRHRAPRARRMVPAFGALAMFLLLGTSPASVEAQEPDLRQLVQRELSYLSIESEALQQQRDSLRALLATQSAQADARARSLSGNIAALELDVARLRQSLERQLATASESDVSDSDGLEGILRRGRDELLDHGIAVPQGNVDESAVVDVFAQWIAFLEDESQVRVESASFYEVEGEQVLNGRVLRVGQVAALLQGPSGIGVGTQDSEGNWIELRRLPDAGIDAALHLQPTPPLSMRLFERGEQGALVVLPARRTLLQQAGPVGLPLVGLGLAACLVTLGKLLQFLWSRWTLQRLPLLQRVVGVGGITDVSVASTLRVAGAVRRLLVVMKTVAGPDQMEQRLVAFDVAVALELQALQRGLGTLKVIAAAAPLLGLLGTVSGMIETFEVINTRGTGDARALSGGIAEALVTTEMGLWIAIPAVLMHTALAGWAERLSLRLSAGAATLTALFSAVSSMQGETATSEDDGDASDPADESGRGT
jgi:biopolymer transport protein ExbB